MREIKFRAKDKNENIWHFGMLTYANFNHGVELAIAVKSELDSIFIVRIDPKTITQYTGIKDKNGVEIYEGDIVKASRGYLGEVDFESFICAKQQKAISDDIEVIGNIYDNLELLEERTNEHR